MCDEKIPHYINDPVINRLTAPENKLYRPEINFKKAFLFIIVSVLAAVIVSQAFLHIQARVSAKRLEFSGVQNAQARVAQPSGFERLKAYFYAQLLILFFGMKYILIWLVRVYQRYARSETRLKCCFTPSCSEYAILAIKKYGAFIGVIKTVGRLKRCHPPGGVDYP